MNFIRGVWIACCLMLGGFFHTGSVKSAEESTSPSTKLTAGVNETDVLVDYLQDIRPILSDACYACHGPDEASRESELRLDLLDQAISADGPDEKVVVAGNPEQSELLRRISCEDPGEVMPPPETGKSLTNEQVSLIRRWIEQGAKWEQHWAFVTPKRPELPSVSSSTWPRNAIDFFVQAVLDQKGLKPSPAAPREVIIRRVTLDLSGLPPTLAEVEAFLADETPQAYERVVDRLLQSPQFGVHMARFWLDAARYGDTHGLHLDNYREMWPFRDWVVNAFNSNLPYDQFVIEQLAGDLLPDPKLDQLVATGFCRAHVTTNEGGSIEEEVHVRNVVDRTSNTATVFLGLTMGCAVCHDHKFDPVTQQEFYEFSAFFNSLDGPALDGNIKDPAPVISVPSEDQASTLASLRDQITQLTEERDARGKSSDLGFLRWIERLGEHDSLIAKSELHIDDQLVVHCTFDDESGDQIMNQADPARQGKLIGANRVAGRTGSGIQFPEGAVADLGNVASFDDDDSFSYGAWVKTANGRNSVVMAKTDPAQLHKGYELSIQEGQVKAIISRRRPGYIVKVVVKEPLITPNEWHHVFVTYDGSKLASGVVIYVDGKPQQVDVWSDALKFKGGIRNSEPLLLGRRDADSHFLDGTIDDVRVYGKRLSESEVRAVFLESELSFLADPPESLNEAQRHILQHFYLMHHDDEFISCSKKLEQLQDQLRKVTQSVPTTLIYRESKNPREAFVLIRGEYDKPREQVQRSTPSALPPMSAEFPRNRLGLARWLVSPENPLTSRVVVNRFWQQLFGIGLVETSEDFGNQGTVPSHPELLDWLAVEFRESGWDIKRLMKQLVLSATYRQSSYVSPTLALKDPKNRFLARGPRFRLDAETLRDQALFLGGDLVMDLGGPSVKPPQPIGLWKAVGFSSSNTVEFVPDQEPDKINRRSLYVFLKRTSPPPEMSTFDAPSRESTCVRRERTNTPLQALLLMNDPQYVSAAQALATRALSAHRLTPAERAAFIYRLCTARVPSEATVAELVELFDEQLEEYEQNDEAAQKLLAVRFGKSNRKEFDTPQLAAWTVVANLVLNLDEVVNKN
ncbi:DUF1553 domain-containing protein [Bythopirellula goksoeyrii]|uniref:Planctomycete cytochrome C n=1 Tax=Bythopirellula goksoeyrii TaxID=1400387 RepID=A0A5B9QTI1_9BACT|nr:DUF1553 domain-containing protein [Bythopirellula goksoeyrii]QEG37411.1 Planctomycete cytochrome C [Bythopirellula goksoeyrii]